MSRIFHEDKILAEGFAGKEDGQFCHQDSRLQKQLGEPVQRAKVDMEKRRADGTAGISIVEKCK